MEELLKVGHLRRITDESDITWRRRIARGELPIVRLSSGSIRIRRRDFERWLESRVQPARSAEPSAA
jgi:hypothetical protein